MPPNKEDAKLNQKQAEKNVLKRIIFRLNLSQPTDLFKEGLLSEFSGKIKNKLNNEKIEERRAYLLQIKGGVSSHTEHEVSLHKFFDDDKKCILTLEPAPAPIMPSLVFEFFSSISSQELAETISSLLNEFSNVYGDVLVKRTGLRFIYVITVPESNLFEWQDIINEELTPRAAFFDTDEISRLMSVIELNRDDYKLRFQYGLFNSEYPNTIARKEFTLDYDCYSEEQIEASSAISLLKAFDKKIRTLFDASVKKI
jgi:uncharacterized protein (TIGR04255 family)